MIYLVKMVISVAMLVYQRSSFWGRRFCPMTWMMGVPWIWKAPNIIKHHHPRNPCWNHCVKPLVLTVFYPKSWNVSIHSRSYQLQRLSSWKSSACCRYVWQLLGRPPAACRSPWNWWFNRSLLGWTATIFLGQFPSVFMDGLGKSTRTARNSWWMLMNVDDGESTGFFHG